MDYQERAAGRPGHYAGWAGSPVIPLWARLDRTAHAPAGAVDDT